VRLVLSQDLDEVKLFISQNIITWVKYGE
jgi:hypothetical protein